MNTTFAVRTIALGLAAGIVGTAGIAYAAAAPAASSTSGTPPRAAAPIMRAEKPVTIEHQVGRVIEAEGVLDGEVVAVTLYENAMYVNQVQVAFPGTDRVGALEQATPFVQDGRFDVTVDVDGQPVRVTGTVAETDVTKVVEPVQDSGEQLISQGTRSLLDAEVAVASHGLAAPLQTTAGFAFDLEVRRVDLYGN